MGKLSFEDLKKILNSKQANTWGFEFYKPVKKAKIKDLKKIRYVLSKCGNALQCFDNKIRSNKDLVLVAVKQNGQAIHWAGLEIQKNTDIINQAIKTGRTDTAYKGKKFKFILPDVSFWHLKFSDKKFKKKETGTIKKLKLNEKDSETSYYTGETLNNVPFGKGSSETYKTSKLDKAVHKKVGNKWIIKLQKNFMVKLEGYNLSEKFIGEWKYGVWDGKGELTEYYEPDYFINKDGTPKIMNIYVGNFKNGKKEGKFRVYQHTGDNKDNWETEYYKNDFVVKKKRKRLKD